MQKKQQFMDVIIKLAKLHTEKSGRYVHGAKQSHKKKHSEDEGSQAEIVGKRNIAHKTMEILVTNIEKESGFRDLKPEGVLEIC